MLVKTMLKLEDIKIGSLLKNREEDIFIIVLTKPLINSHYNAGEAAYVAQVMWVDKAEWGSVWTINIHSSIWELLC